MPQEVPGSSRTTPPIPATREAESPALGGNPRLSPLSPEAPRPACHAGGRGVRVPSLPSHHSSAHGAICYGKEAPVARDSLELCGAAVFELDADPATRSLTVLDTSTSPGWAWDATRAPVWTAIPVTLPSTTSHSPVCTPARTAMPNSRTESVIEHAQRDRARRPIEAGKGRRPQCPPRRRDSEAIRDGRARDVVGGDRATRDRRAVPRVRSRRRC